MVDFEGSIRLLVSRPDLLDLLKRLDRAVYIMDDSLDLTRSYADELEREGLADHTYDEQATVLYSITPFGKEVLKMIRELYG